MTYYIFITIVILLQFPNYKCIGSNNDILEMLNGISEQEVIDSNFTRMCLMFLFNFLYVLQKETNILFNDL